MSERLHISRWALNGPTAQNAVCRTGALSIFQKIPRHTVLQFDNKRASEGAPHLSKVVRLVPIPDGSRAREGVCPGSGNERTVKNIVDPDRTFNHSLVVKGVENERRLRCLSPLRCSQFQGYFFGRPLAASVRLEFVFAANREIRPPA